MRFRTSFAALYGHRGAAHFVKRPQIPREFSLNPSGRFLINVFEPPYGDPVGPRARKSILHAVGPASPNRSVRPLAPSFYSNGTARRLSRSVAPGRGLCLALARAAENRRPRRPTRQWALTGRPVGAVKRPPVEERLYAPGPRVLHLRRPPECSKRRRGSARRAPAAQRRRRPAPDGKKKNKKKKKNARKQQGPPRLGLLGGPFLRRRTRSFLNEDY